MLCSVVIPVYNGGKYLAEAVESARAQEGARVEVIVVDDGSEEDIAAALGALRGEVKLIRQEHRGLPAARNTGVRAAGGEVVAFLDADDRFRPGRMAAHVAVLQAHPQAGLVFSRHSYFGTGEMEGLPREITEKILADPRPARHILDCCFMAVGAQTVWRKALLAAGGFDESLRAAEDWEMWVRLSLLTPFVFHDAVVVDIRLHEGRMSEDREAMREAQQRVLQRSFCSMAHALAAGEMTLGALDRWTPQTYYNLGNAAYRLGFGGLARKCFMRAARLAPGRFLFSAGPVSCVKSLLGSGLLRKARALRARRRSAA